MRASPIRWLVWVTVGVVAAFIGSSVFLAHRISGIDARIGNIVAAASPAIAALSAARGEVRYLELGIGRYLGARADGGTYDVRQLEAMRGRVDEQLALYASVPIFENELPRVDRLTHAKRRLYETVDRVLFLVDEKKLSEARAALYNDVTTAAQTVDEDIEQLILLNAAESDRNARAIQDIRRQTTQTAFLINGIIVLSSAVLLLLAIRASQLYQAVVAERERSADERAVELDRFAARVAHDLKAPLSSILMGINIAAAYPDKMPRALEKIEKASRRMSAMIDALLDFARAGSRTHRGESTLIATVLDEVVEEIAPAAEAAAATLSVEAFPRQYAVACSSGVLSSVLSNILQNAVKYITDAKGERRIVVRVQDGRSGKVRIEVDDTGPGLPPGAESKVFETFVRATDNTEKPGLGLGLATVKRLVEEHEGSVGIRSQPGKGCHVWVDLPLSAKPEPVAQS